MAVLQRPYLGMGQLQHLHEPSEVRNPNSGMAGMAAIHPSTPLKTNMSPENQWLENVFPIELVPF